MLNCNTSNAAWIISPLIRSVWSITRRSLHTRCTPIESVAWIRGELSLSVRAAKVAANAKSSRFACRLDGASSRNSSGSSIQFEHFTQLSQLFRKSQGRRDGWEVRGSPSDRRAARKLTLVADRSIVLEANGHRRWRLAGAKFVKFSYRRGSVDAGYRLSSIESRLCRRDPPRRSSRKRMIESRMIRETNRDSQIRSRMRIRAVTVVSLRTVFRVRARTRTKRAISLIVAAVLTGSRLRKYRYRVPITPTPAERTGAVISIPRGNFW